MDLHENKFRCIDVVLDYMRINGKFGGFGSFITAVKEVEKFVLAAEQEALDRLSNT